MLEIKDLTHSYGDHVVLEKLNLEVAQGELVSIVGPSGCGKSTLLRNIAGLIAPTSGSVVLNGTPIQGVPDDLAVVFQDYSRSLLPWLTVRDNVALPLRRKGGSKAERRAQAETALESVGLADAGKKYPWQLSGGMQQRVSIARALAYRPSLLLMDEPFGSVDAQTREDLEDLVLKVHREEGMTILLVTHDIDESVYVGDRVVVLGRNPGRVRAELPVELPADRDQIGTRADAEFVRLRAEVGKLVRGAAAADPMPDEHEPAAGTARDEKPKGAGKTKRVKKVRKADAAKADEAKDEREDGLETGSVAEGENADTAEDEAAKAVKKTVKDGDETTAEAGTSDDAEGGTARGNGDESAEQTAEKAEDKPADKAEGEAEGDVADEAEEVPKDAEAAKGDKPTGVMSAAKVKK